MIWRRQRNGVTEWPLPTQWKEFGFRIPGMLSTLLSFFLKKWVLLLSQTITSAKPLLRQQDTSHSATGTVPRPGTSAQLMTGETREARNVLPPVPESYYNKLPKTSLARYVFCLIFADFHFPEDELWTNHVFFHFPVFSLIPARTSTQAIKWMPFNLFWNTSELSRNKIP